jgi:hypothetical protein
VKRDSEEPLPLGRIPIGCIKQRRRAPIGEGDTSRYSSDIPARQVLIEGWRIEEHTAHARRVGSVTTRNA